MGDDSPMSLGLGRKTLAGKRRDCESPTVVAPSQTSDSIPKASPSAVQFLRSLDDDDYKRLNFSDRLTTFSDNEGKEIGSFSISSSVASSSSHPSSSHPSSSNGLTDGGCGCGGGGGGCGGGGGFVVRATSVGRLDGILCGTKLTSHISRHMLETIEHHQHDFLFLSDESLMRDTTIVKQANGGGYVLSQTTSRGQDVKKTTRFIDDRNATGLITEGADLIIQRILALKGDVIPTDFQLISFDMNCNIAPAKYERLEEKMESLPGVSSSSSSFSSSPSAGLFGICRTIDSWKDKPLTWHSYFTSSGQLTFRHQIGSSVSMKLSSNDRTENVGEEIGPNLLNCTDEISERTKITRSHASSGYSNGKTKSSTVVVDSKTYLRHHPELNSITTDFLQLLLIQKPSNVPLFAANYFSSLTTDTESTETTAVGTT